jgi:anti-sigma factor ChrR (cupin superfamily)
MNLNADFTARASAHGASMAWISSPAGGVDRRMLDRVGDEVARATTIVRFAPGSKFPAHVHGGGEEFVVLEGVFQDEHGDFPVGSYIRNPPTSRHTPASEPGCTILVKLWQFRPEDRTHVRTHIDRVAEIPDPARAGVTLSPLYRDAEEDVRIERWAPGAAVPVGDAGGVEIFVLEGGFEEGGEAFAPLSWLRLPPGAAATAKAGPQGARVWVKSGHLRTVRAPSQAA